MSEIQTKPTRKPRERLAFKVVKGGLVPADAHTTNRMRERGYSMGDTVFVEITKPRNPGFWGLAHRIGTLCVRSIDEFAGMTAHQALKKIQFDANIECDVTETAIPGIGVMTHRKPRSLAFESMDQGLFYEVTRAFCRHIAKTHWPLMTEDQIAEMAESMVNE